ncbi:hypothetical protein BpHYR1_033181 [Brachionus plicatilis]|uniref:Uncharacterized protein n=1 Tax=Brachionus plicatilis TaxID=10195 RepID=A0A3M7QDI6_BRAPC|nr:hypothetical protein BpHYR1_033181 [Brachionus plicatilis]
MFMDMGCMLLSRSKRGGIDKHVVGKELVLQYLTHSGPEIGISLEQIVDQSFCRSAHLIRRNGVLIFFYLGIGVFEATGLEGWLANQQRVQNASQRPHVHFLQVPVDDLVVVQILARLDYLPHEVARLGLSDRLASLVHFHETAPATQLQYYVHVVFVFEKRVELDNVLMVDGPVDRYFLGHFFLLVLLGQQLFADYFSRENLFGVHLGELVAASEAALAKKLSLHVPVARGRIDHDVRDGKRMERGRILLG